MANQDLINEILQLKKMRNVALLAHYYEESVIQDIADFVGDSYQLAQFGQQTSSPTILFCGVYFMAESVKILNPKKTVLVPDPEAGCSLVDSSPYESYLKWRKDHPKALAVTYINSSAAVKSISDVIITSSNAENIIRSIPADREILFGPDQHLGRHLSYKLNRPMILWPGSCQVHMLFSAKRIVELKMSHPEAIVLAHPECEEAVLQVSDIIGSTSRLIQEVQKNPAKTFIVATEEGIFHQMKKLRPTVKLIQAPTKEESCGCNTCPYMRLNTLEKVLRSLRENVFEVSPPDTVREKALIPLERMMKISFGQKVDWPTSF